MPRGYRHSLNRKIGLHLGHVITGHRHRTHGHRPTQTPKRQTRQTCDPHMEQVKFRMMTETEVHNEMITGPLRPPSRNLVDGHTEICEKRKHVVLT